MDVHAVGIVTLGIEVTCDIHIDRPTPNVSNVNGVIAIDVRCHVVDVNRHGAFRGADIAGSAISDVVHEDADVTSVDVAVPGDVHITQEADVAALVLTTHNHDAETVDIDIR